MKFKKLSGDVNWQEYGGKFVSKKLNNGDFDYWLVLDVINIHDATGEDGIDKYNVSILAVSPQQAGKKGIDAALSSCGLSDEQMTAYNNDPLTQVEALAEYGIYAMLWQNSGNNIKALITEAHKESELINMLFGFYMDRPENGLGQNGWELIAGQDTREFLNK